MNTTHLVLALAAFIFAAFVVIQVRPSFGAAGRKSVKGMREARARAARASTPEERAEHLTEAAELAARAGRHLAAGGLFLRALRADPHTARRVSQMAAALRPRPRLLESLLLRRIEVAESGSEALRTMLLELEGVYERRKDRHKRALVARLRAHEEAAVPDESAQVGADSAAKVR